LINDLNKKVAILERELQLVHENFEHEIEQYRLNGGGPKKKGPGNSTKSMDELEELTLQKLKQELVKARFEVD